MRRASRKLTYADYVKLPDDGNRYEIINGRLWVNGSRDNKRHRIYRALYKALDRYAETSDLYLSLAAPDPTARTDIYRLAINGKDHRPRLGVEILNRRISEVNQTKRYERFRADEYWFVDPIDNTVRMLRLQDETAERIIVTETITSPLLPGFTLPLRDIFAD